ncbi:MAG: PQQ-dependent sugar dehydrogenase [Patescibacteria group bacterium]
MKWVVGILIVVVVAGVAVYYNAWGIAAQLLPLIERSEQVRVSPPSEFTVPAGFEVSIYSDSVPGARVMMRDPKGTLIVSESSEGRVVALPDTNSDNVADQVIEMLTGLENPHGLAFVCPDTGFVSADQDACLLYVAESNAVKSYVYDADTYHATYKETVVTLPTAGGGHSTRSLHLHPDGKRLLVSVGSSCNVCREDSEKRAAVVAVDLTTMVTTLYARGLRNSVFMALHPLTGDLWATEMGRDLLGDDIPPDEVNIIEENKNYGWPICYGQNIHDTQFDTNTYIRNPCMEPFEAPALIDIPAHSAPLGIAFVPEEGWPEAYWHDALIAYHGSWNRSVPTGYKVVRHEVDDKGMPTGVVSDFMTGFIKPDDTVIGRPVGVMTEPGGTVYITDDRAGAIYRVRRVAP